jgi:hypothetical protein
MLRGVGIGEDARMLRAAAGIEERAGGSGVVLEFRPRTWSTGMSDPIEPFQPDAAAQERLQHARAEIDRLEQARTSIGRSTMPLNHAIGALSGRLGLVSGEQLHAPRDLEPSIFARIQDVTAQVPNVAAGADLLDGLVPGTAAEVRRAQELLAGVAERVPATLPDSPEVQVDATRVLDDLVDASGALLVANGEVRGAIAERTAALAPRSV